MDDGQNLPEQSSSQDDQDSHLVPSSESRSQDADLIESVAALNLPSSPQRQRTRNDSHTHTISFAPQNSEEGSVIPSPPPSTSRGEESVRSVGSSGYNADESSAQTPGSSGENDSVTSDTSSSPQTTEQSEEENTQAQQAAQGHGDVNGDLSQLQTETEGENADDEADN